ncbi:MAG: hypothetical protein ACYS0G_09030 [Planctomycetota bacterium]|jgi:hypothetical protein
MGEFVIAAYRPLEGRERELLEEVRQHLPTLRGQGLVTDRPSLVMRAKDGTIVEVFEWESLEAIAQAHENEVVQAMWGRFSQVCEYVSLAKIDECQRPFPSFEPVEL